MELLKGNAQTGISSLRIIGIAGAIIGIAAHFMVWTEISTGTSNPVQLTGLSGYGAAGIGLLAVFALLLFLDSVYAILVLALFIPYMMEQLVGLNLLRYMPLDSTKLRMPLYLMVPTGFMFALIGAFAPILSRIKEAAKA